MSTSTHTFEQLQSENHSLKNEISFLKEQLDWFKRQIFGQRSEKRIDLQNSEQLCFEGFDKVTQEQAEDLQAIPSHHRKKRAANGKDKITFPADIPVERNIIDIPEEAKVCPESGTALVKIGEEVSSKLAHKPGTYYIKQIVRPKYAHPDKSEAGIFIADLPESLLSRCQADESLLADILVKKYADHLPLCRQSEILSRLGINISRQILSQWVIKAGMALKPLYEALQSSVLQSGNIFLDETPLDMLDPGKGKTHQAYMWVIAGGKSANPGNRVYHFSHTRSHGVAKVLLKGYFGVVHSDKYGAYESLASQKLFTWCPCWAHIRRKFIEAETGDPPFQKWVLRQIKYLFMLEKIAWARSEEERLRIRQKKEAPIIDGLIAAIKEKLVNGKILPKSKLREALGYFCGLIPYLKNYIQQPYARLDNNVAERAIRPLTIGRKNWLFAGNEAGGEASAIIFSLVQTCRALDINPYEYLDDVMRRLMSHPSSKIAELLPENWKK